MPDVRGSFNSAATAVAEAAADKRQQQQHSFHVTGSIEFTVPLLLLLAQSVPWSSLQPVTKQVEYTYEEKMCAQHSWVVPPHDVLL